MEALPLIQCVDLPRVFMGIPSASAAFLAQTGLAFALTIAEPIPTRALSCSSTTTHRSPATWRAILWPMRAKGCGR